MWERKQLKEKAKASFKANYWKSVLVALVFALFAGGMSAATGFGEDSDSDGAAVTESYEEEHESEDDGTVFKIIEKGSAHQRTTGRFLRSSTRTFRSLRTH